MGFKKGASVKGGKVTPKSAAPQKTGPSPLHPPKRLPSHDVGPTGPGKPATTGGGLGGSKAKKSPGRPAY